MNASTTKVAQASTSRVSLSQTFPASTLSPRPPFNPTLSATKSKTVSCRTLSSSTVARSGTSRRNIYVQSTLQSRSLLPPFPRISTPWFPRCLAWLALLGLGPACRQMEVMACCYPRNERHETMLRTSRGQSASWRNVRSHRCPHYVSMQVSAALIMRRGSRTAHRVCCRQRLCERNAVSSATASRLDQADGITPPRNHVSVPRGRCCRATALQLLLYGLVSTRVDSRLITQLDGKL